MKRTIHNINKQQGIVLVVALLILVVMTVLGVSMLSTSTLEERMAGNIQAKNVTFQAAESCIREALLPVNKFRRDAAINGTVLANPNLNCNYNGVPATVLFTVPANTSKYTLVPGSGTKAVKPTPVIMTSTSTLASGTSSTITFAGNAIAP